MLLRKTGLLRFEVRDTGIGITLEKQEEIFSPFIQVDGSTTRSYGGTGLGLSIIKKLLEVLEGRYELESEINKGSCFRIFLPLGIGDEK